MNPFGEGTPNTLGAERRKQRAEQQTFQIAETESDGIVRTWWIDTPNGRMKVVMPAFVSHITQKRRMDVIVDALNKDMK